MSEPTPSVPVVRLPSRRIVAGVVLALAGVLAVVGTFLGLYQLTLVGYPLRGAPFIEAFPVTSWTTEFPTYVLPVGSVTRNNFFGVPVIVAAALAFYAANLLLRGHDPLRRLVRIRLFAVAATGLVAGYVWYAVANLIDSISTNPDPTTYSYTVGAGLWVLISATLVGALGSVLLLGLVPTAAPAPAQPVDEAVVYQVDVDTPPMGFEVPVNLPPTDTYQPPEKS